jgi:hypothetical protein
MTPPIPGLMLFSLVPTVALSVVMSSTSHIVRAFANRVKVDGARSHSLMVLVPNLGHGLTKVHLDSSIINQSIIHFEVGLFALLFVRKLYKGITQ